jgi:hypothetical protein
LRELVSRLARLFARLLKSQFQPNRRSRSWTLTIKEQRRRFHRHLAQNPSLKAKLEQAVLDAYGDAILEAARETRLAEEVFPPICPFTIEQILNGEVPGDGPE